MAAEVGLDMIDRLGGKMRGGRLCLMKEEDKEVRIPMRPRRKRRKKKVVMKENKRRKKR
jgi:hypothetical protein